MYKGEFKDGKPTGDWVRFYESGQIKARLKYVADSDSAFVNLYDQYGKKIAEGLYVNEKKEGTWLLFSENIKVAEEKYAGGQKHGISRKFYPSGEVYEEAEWVEGKLEGKYQVFFKDGKPYMQCKLSNNKRNGLFLLFYENGRMEMEAYYQDNLRQGEWKFYDISGGFRYSLKYDNGKLLNPEVRDSIDNIQMQELDKQKLSIPDPEKFMQDPAEYMNIIQKMR
jgi:antitoxin component YwqK of YwqJK toxin-antitoxin module